MKLKLPKFKFPRLGPSKKTARPRKYNATARRAVPVMDEYEDEPTTRLSSAFIVVLILHVVAVGGIYAFNSIKAHRKAKGIELLSEKATPAKKPATAAAAPDGKPAPAVAAMSSVAPLPASASGGVVNTPAATVHQSAPTTATVPVSGARVYRVKGSDSLAKIASIYAITVADLAEANGIKETAILKPGTVLNIPSSKGSKSIAQTSSATTAADQKRAEFLATKKGDEAALKAMNGTTKPPATATTAAAAATAPTRTSYTVAKGESLVGISKKLGVSFADLAKLNGIEDPKKLQIGQVLKVPPKK